LFMAFGESGPSSDDLLHRADQAFRSGLASEKEPEQARAHFQEASRLYATLRERGIANTDLCRNEGNAALLAGDLPHAILAFRRGLRLKPADSGLLANLQSARSLVDSSLVPAADNGWTEWLARRRAAWMFPVACLLYSAACVLTYRWWLSQETGDLFLAGMVLLLALLIAAPPILAEWSRHQDEQRPLVVIVKDVFARTGNGPLYPRRHETPLSPGMEARLLCVRGSWMRIELANGTSGWVPVAATIGM
jgi:hypothetical protein